jgi:hypothetical protein
MKPDSWQCMGQKITSYPKDKACVSVNVVKKVVAKIPPVPSLKAPTSANVCGRTVYIRGSNSKPGIGRKLVYSWQAAYTDASDTPTLTKIKDLFKKLTDKNRNMVYVTRSDLEAGKTLKVTMCVTNVQKEQACLDHEMDIESDMVKPEVSIYGRAERNIKASWQLKILPRVIMKQCGKYSRVQFVYNWDIQPDNAVIDSTKRRLVIPRGTLVAGQKYNVTLTAALESNMTIEDSATVQVTVRQSRLRGMIGRGAPVRAVSCQESFKLSANMQDPDNSDEEESYLWECIDRVTQMPCLYNDGKEITAATT